MPAALSIEHLTKRYPKLVALDDVSLTIQEGEIFALLGPNGAGKTTLIGAVCGLVKKTSGKIHVLGQDLDVDEVKPRFAVGLVPQEVNFDPFFTVKESLHIQAGLYGKPRNEARVQELLSTFELLDKANAQGRALSGGMKRRLLIAKALVHEPKLLFLDEPTAGVDVELRRDLWAYVRKLRAGGTTIVLTTHYLEEAEELADRVGIIHHGKLVLVEEKAALMKRLGERELHVRFASPVPSSGAPAGVSGWSEDRLSLIHVERRDGLTATEVLARLYGAGLPVSEVETRRSRLEDILIGVLKGAAP